MRPLVVRYWVRFLVYNTVSSDCNIGNPVVCQKFWIWECLHACGKKCRICQTNRSNCKYGTSELEGRKLFKSVQKWLLYRWRKRCRQRCGVFYFWIFSRWHEKRNKRQLWLHCRKNTHGWETQISVQFGSKTTQDRGMVFHCTAIESLIARYLKC